MKEERPDNELYAAFDQFRKIAVQHNAERHLALFSHTGNGLLIWKAYQEYRRAGLPVAENVLKKLDQYAGRLLDDDGADFLEALDLGFNKKGGQGPRLDLQSKQRARDIVEHVHILHKHTGRTLNESFRAAAKQARTTPGAVKRLWYDWGKRSRQW